MSTINDLSVASSVSSDDKLPIWQSANGVTRALPVAVFDARYVLANDIASVIGNAIVETFTAGDGVAPNTFNPGVTTALTLANEYGSAQNIEVFFDSSYQGIDQYALVGLGLAFSSPIPVGVQKVFVRGGAVQTVGAPGDGTVTDVKLAEGSDVYNRTVDTISVSDFGVKGDGFTDNTTAYTAAINAAVLANKTLFFPAGTYLGTLPTVSGSVRLRGDGMDKTILKRSATNIGGLMAFTGINTTVMVEHMSLDGNSSNNSNPGHNIFVASGLASFNLWHCRVHNATNYGVLIGNAAANRLSAGIHRISFCEIHNNTSGGIDISQESFVQITDNDVYSNGGTGIGAAFYVFPPVASTQRFVQISRNQVHNHNSAGGAGIFVLGYVTGGSSSQPAYGPGTNSNDFFQITDNVVYSNSGYGLVCQANYFTVANNICNFNGDYSSPNGSAYAGILCNGSNGTVTGNMVYGNSGFGVDMGGTQYFTFSGNTVMQNATAAGGGFIGLNLGACEYGNVSGNTIGLNGPIASGHQIEVPGFDGGVNAFPLLTLGLSIKDNLLINGFGSAQIGIFAYGNPTSCSITGNHIQGGTDNNAIVLRTNARMHVTGNTCDATSISGPSINSANATIVPDWAEVLFVNGGTAINDILTYSQANLLNAVCEAIVTNGGTGYDPASPPAVAISGGGGTGAAAVAAVDGNGHVISIKITAQGSGYTSAPTISIAAPSSGTTATATAVTNCNNATGRKITMEFSSTTAITAGNHIAMPTSSISAGANTCVDWLGLSSGVYALRSRSS